MLDSSGAKVGAALEEVQESPLTTRTGITIWPGLAPSRTMPLTSTVTIQSPLLKTWMPSDRGSGVDEESTHLSTKRSASRARDAASSLQPLGMVPGVSTKVSVVKPSAPGTPVLGWVPGAMK